MDTMKSVIMKHGLCGVDLNNGRRDEDIVYIIGVG
jgi:hypothetical protein